MKKLSLVLPETPPYHPRQFGRCAVIGNSGDLLKTKFGKEIDGYDVVIRENGAPIQVKLLQCWCCQFCYSLQLINVLPFLLFDLLQNYSDYVGKKSTFRLLNRGSAKALDKVVELDGMSTILCCNLWSLSHITRSTLKIWVLQKQGRKSWSLKPQFMTLWTKWYGFVSGFVLVLLVPQTNNFGLQYYFV